MRRGEHNNSRNSSWVPSSQVDGRRKALLSGQVCHMLSLRCRTEVTGLRATDTYDVRDMYVLLLPLAVCIIAAS